ncbi:MAG TPA: GNAT family N-acetyltransferase [Vicinamibacterales bacterium]|nr:GNAT family N-acetyltransferase [Vicinamibacterales bacterium]
MIDVALERVPDVPQRVDTRGMLLSGRAEVVFPSEPESAADGFVVSVPDAGLASIVGRPPRALIRDAVERLEGHVNVLCLPADAAYVAAALAGWLPAVAILHTLPHRPEWSAEVDEASRVFTAVDTPHLTHVPGPLRRELLDALRGRTTARFVPGELPDRDAPPPLEAVPMSASWAGALPVSFCYPVVRTESWWDVAVETIEAYRRQGHAGRAVRALVRHLWTTGRAPVWGTLDDNTGSLALARQLGFREVGRLTVFAAP